MAQISPVVTEIFCCEMQRIRPGAANGRVVE